MRARRNERLQGIGRQLDVAGVDGFAGDVPLAAVVPARLVHAAFDAGLGQSIGGGVHVLPHTDNCARRVVAMPG